MLDGIVLGSGGTIITTARGKKALKDKGVDVVAVDLTKSLLYRAFLNGSP
jgi:cysteine synthase